jgi:S1-C subfamily serine protease
VATNAHVIAGVKRPIIKYGGKSYEGIPVYFDSGLDLALLRVSGLKAPTLALAPKTVSLGSTVAVLGYPGGNYLVTPGLLRDTAALSAANIYDMGSFGRGIYQLQATVNYGNSGGPVVLANGQAVGIIFSKSTDVSDIAYALTSPHIIDAIRQVGASHARVSTRACLAD